MNTLAVGTQSYVPNPPTFIEIVLDETGSMSRCQHETVNGFNSFIAEHRGLDGDCYLTLTKFDTTSLKTPYVNLSIDMVPNLSFYPGASTNLYDVIGQRLTAINSRPSVKTMMVIITDGEDNASREFNLTSVRNLIEDSIKNGISFLYYGAGSNARRVAEQMGIPSDSITVFDVAEMASTMNAMTASTRAFRAS